MDTTQLELGSSVTKHLSSGLNTVWQAQSSMLAGGITELPFFVCFELAAEVSFFVVSSLGWIVFRLCPTFVCLFNLALISHSFVRQGIDGWGLARSFVCS